MTVNLDLQDDGVAVLTLDDGAKNALSLAMIGDLGLAITKAADAKAIVIAGREGALSAGLDLKHIQEHGPKGASDLIRSLGEVLLPLWTDPRPVVCAATGHALAGGTIVAMACDHVVAAEGPWKWGLIETSVGLAVPAFGMALARHRLQPRHINQYVIPGARVDAATAVEIGFADELLPADEVLDRALAVARERMQLPANAYAAMKERLRGADARAALEGADADLAEIVRLLVPST